MDERHSNFGWDNFQNGINTRFGCQHSCLSLAWMWDNLKHKDSNNKHIKAHDKIRTLASNKVEANHGLVYHLFLRNLKPGVARFIRNKYCATICCKAKKEDLEPCFPTQIWKVPILAKACVSPLNK